MSLWGACFCAELPITDILKRSITIVFSFSCAILKPADAQAACAPIRFETQHSATVRGFFKIRGQCYGLRVHQGEHVSIRMDSRGVDFAVPCVNGTTDFVEFATAKDKYEVEVAIVGSVPSGQPFKLTVIR